MTRGLSPPPTHVHHFDVPFGLLALSARGGYSSAARKESLGDRADDQSTQGGRGASAGTAGEATSLVDGERHGRRGGRG